MEIFNWKIINEKMMVKNNHHSSIGEYTNEEDPYQLSNKMMVLMIKILWILISSFKC